MAGGFSIRSHPGNPRLNRKMSGFIVQISAAHDPLKPSAWLAGSNGDAPSVAYDRNRARVFETAEEARSVAAHYRESKRLPAADFLVRRKRRAA
jgi:hypothetical protein